MPIGLSLRKKIGSSGPFGDLGGPFLSTGSQIFFKIRIFKKIKKGVQIDFFLKSKVTLLLKWGQSIILIFLKMKKLNFKKKKIKKIRDPVDKNGPPGSPNGPFGPIFFLRLSPIGKLECTTYLQLPK